MESGEIHYLNYDPEMIYRELQYAHMEAGGDVLYPGDEKEINLRFMQMALVQALAKADNDMRMATLRFAVRGWLDLIGEGRDCPRIQAKAAKATVEIKFRATGKTGVLEAGTPLTADGSLLYTLDENITQTGYQQTVRAKITASEAGSVGNGLVAGTQMQFLIPAAAVESVFCVSDAAGGQEREEDEAYRERIRTHGLATVTTGPEAQYEAMAKNVSSNIIDAKANKLSPGRVGVYLLLASSTGADALIEDVKTALNGQKERPMSDEVSVYLADDVPYTLNVKYRAAPGSNVTAALAEAVTAYQRWQEGKIGRAFDPDWLIAMLYQAGATRVVFGEGSAFDGGEVTYTEIENTEHCKGTITLGGDLMIELNILPMMPAFLLADQNGYAQAKALERGLEIFCQVLQEGIDTLFNVEKMPEWRLDEVAWERNILWYDHTASVEVKREVIQNSDRVYRHLGTKWAVENVIQTYFGDGYIKEWFEYDGTPGKFQVHSTNPALNAEKFQEFISILEKVKRLSSELEGVYIEMSNQFELSYGLALHEYGRDTYDFGT